MDLWERIEPFETDWREQKKNIKKHTQNRGSFDDDDDEFICSLTDSICTIRFNQIKEMKELQFHIKQFVLLCFSSGTKAISYEC